MRWILLLGGVGLMAGCDDPKSPAQTSPQKFRFAFIPKMRDNPVFNYAKAAAEHRARELGNVEIEWRAPGEANAIEQAEIVRRMTRTGIHGIAISCNEPEPLREAINEAVAAGVPVICFDSDSPSSKRKYLYGTDDVAAGGILARELARLMDGKGEVAILSGFSGAENLNRRIQGAKEYLAKHHPEIKVVYTLYCNDDSMKAIQDIAAYMKTNPNLGGWLMVGGWPLFGTNAFEGIDTSKTKVVAFDALPEEWPYLENGDVQVLVTQDIWGWGEKGVDILLALAQGKTYPGADPRGCIAAPNEVLSRETLSAYKKRWKGWFGGIQ